MFSTFPACSQMPVAFCHSVIHWDWVWEMNDMSLAIFLYGKSSTIFKYGCGCGHYFANAIFM